MYVEFFGLDENPFSITPDPRYLFMSKRHREALAHLLYGIGEGGGFVQLTGEIGMGKTTLCRGLLEQLPANTDVALILNPRLTAIELVAAVCDELQVPYPAATTSLKVLVDTLNHHLLDAHARGRHTVLIIDEAQNLSTDVLEQVRLLTNLETAKKKLLQIILIGQPELQAVLERPDLRQLAQRITARYHLAALSREETTAYVLHRLAIAGVRDPIFVPAALRALHRLSGGIPRRINIICDRAMLGAYAQDRHRIDARMVRRAAAEVMSGNRDRRSRTPMIAAASLAAAALLFGAAWTLAPSWLPIVHAPRRAPVEAVHRAPAMAAAGPTASAPEKSKPVVADAVATPPDLAGLLEASADATDMNNAFATLFAQWTLDYGALVGTTACERAAAAGLRCLHRAGTWNNLRSFNRPVVIELILAGDRRYYAVVETLGARNVTLAFAGKTYEFPISAVEPYWFGEFLLLWKPPGLHGDTIYPGTRGSDVLWLRARLDDVLGPAAAPADPARFDEDLKTRVIEFQHRHNLVEDGIVGEQTLVYLQALVDAPGVPVLAARSE